MSLHFFLARTMFKPQVERANALGWGEMCVRQLPFRGLSGQVPVILDNGAYIDFRQGRGFNEAAFSRMLDEWAARGLLPVAVVAPDIVAGGQRSLYLSYSWLPRLRAFGAPILLPVQNGMCTEEAALALTDFDGLFVGGDTWWKFITGPTWVRMAHAAGKPCHVGRIGTGPRIVWARAAGADSCDSTTPLRQRRNWLNAERALAANVHMPPEALHALSRKLAGPAPWAPRQHDFPWRAAA